MFIKNIVLGVLGIIIFPILYLFFSNPTVLIFGMIVSILLVLFYFVNVYVMGKRRTFFTSLSSWIVILSFGIPLSYFFTKDIYNIIIYTGTISLSLSWLLVLYELIASETFKGY
ncbi:MAG: hypothetical protein N2712_05470 [Brevinematales bacterium]|nr:hypothetical protein [Brevinematales bacterium]